MKSKSGYFQLVAIDYVLQSVDDEVTEKGDVKVNAVSYLSAQGGEARRYVDDMTPPNALVTGSTPYCLVFYSV